MAVALAIGTVKGGWIARSVDRTTWDLAGPFLKGWEVNSFGQAPDGSHLAATGSSWYGAALHRSHDLETWTQIVDGPAYTAATGPKLVRIWTLRSAGDDLFAGVAEAGLFHSDDSGEHWAPVPALNDHETRPGWQPGAGGLAAHRILVDPAAPERMWVGISAVGVFRTEDGGASWVLRNAGVPAAGPNDEYPDIGFCVHGLVADPASPETIWRQDHMGVFRTTDGGDSWERIEEGLPAGFGFAIDRDPATGRLFVAPLEGAEFRAPVGGSFHVFASDDGGSTWQPTGDASSPAYDAVLRDAMTVDGGDPGGVYVGTSSGRIRWSADNGDTWSELEQVFPRILSLHAFAV